MTSTIDGVESQLGSDISNFTGGLPSAFGTTVHGLAGPGIENIPNNKHKFKSFFGLYRPGLFGPFWPCEGGGVGRGVPCINFCKTVYAQ